MWAELIADDPVLAPELTSAHFQALDGWKANWRSSGEMFDNLIEWPLLGMNLVTHMVGQRFTHYAKATECIYLFK